MKALFILQLIDDVFVCFLSRHMYMLCVNGVWNDFQRFTMQIKLYDKFHLSFVSLENRLYFWTVFYLEQSYYNRSYRIYLYLIKKMMD